MATVKQADHATVDDLDKTPGKAEIINGTLVLMPPTGVKPGHAATAIVANLYAYAKRTGRGRAFGDNVGFLVDLPNRQSFSPDAAFCLDEQSSMKFYKGAPTFAVEVRSETDYGPAAERKIAAKRADYFAAGTQVVWDVDLLADDLIRVYRADKPDSSTIYQRGENAEAEPALPGWTMPVEELVLE